MAGDPGEQVLEGFALQQIAIRHGGLAESRQLSVARPVHVDGDAAAVLIHIPADIAAQRMGQRSRVCSISSALSRAALAPSSAEIRPAPSISPTPSTAWGQFHPIDPLHMGITQTHALYMA